MERTVPENHFLPEAATAKHVLNPENDIGKIGQYISIKFRQVLDKFKYNY